MSGLAITDLSVLLLEPSVTQQHIISRELLKAGVARADCAASGREALELVDRYQPDLVVGAMYYPDMDALDFMRALRDHAGRVPFMLVSSETRLSQLDVYKQNGVIAILPKPFSIEDLQRALLATRDYLDEEEVELAGYDATALKVLMVDDSRVARRHLMRVLAGMGISNITEAENGQEAVAILDRQLFDLIVTDFNMPEMDGEELVRRIRGNPVTSDIPIMMVTSEQDTARLANVERSGVSALCDKPFEPATVRTLLARILH